MDYAALDLRRDGDVPVGAQLARQLRAAIAARRLTPGQRLPGVRELAALVGVNANTVQAVYARLADEGWLRREHGRGSFVSERPPEAAQVVAAAASAAASAREQGLDPREVAAFMLAEPGAAPARRRAPDGTAAERRRLREEIELLERRLSLLDPRAAAEALRAPVRSAGGRLLDADELRRVRDALAARVDAVRHDRLERHRAVLTARYSPAAARGAWRTGGAWTRAARGVIELRG